MKNEADDILRENKRRQNILRTAFNPVTGQGSIGKRIPLRIPDFPIPLQHIPEEMASEPLVKAMTKAKTLEKLLTRTIGMQATEQNMEQLVTHFTQLRARYDFPFWAASFVYIKRKGGGGDTLFRLNRPQRRFVEKLEKLRNGGKPIRIVMLKARQWGGSTVSQIYMAWLQLIHKEGLNSLIIAHQASASEEIKDMFDRMIKEYPLYMLHKPGDAFPANEPKITGVGKSGSTFRVPQRNCKIKIGTAERPDSCRGGDYNLVHLSEVGIWKNTEGKKPEDIVTSACSGILLKPYTMIICESTAKGAGNFFHTEYLDAKKGTSQFIPHFVPWFEIEQYELPFDSQDKERIFAERLCRNKNNAQPDSERQEPGTYLYSLWKKGATLEAINWYEAERSKFSNHASMASEYPSDDIEAFTFAGRKVFLPEDIEQLRDACRPPKVTGEICGRADEGEDALEELQLVPMQNGRLFVWHDAERQRDNTETVTDRYLTVVDVCKGHTDKADFADILVLDRIFMAEGLPPVVAAEWHGHIDMDKLAWKAAQIAAYYDNALLVIESNTLETNNTKGEAEYILTLIHDAYGQQLYARKQSAEDIRQKLPKKYGFHTNTLTKKVIIYNLKTAIRQKLYVEREHECLNEYLTYAETDNNSFEALPGYHDDRLMTRAIGLHVCFNEMEPPRILPKNIRHPNGTNKPVSEASI